MANKEDKSIDLRGWAAIVGAIATLITAIGFPDFFPDLVKHFLSEVYSQPAISTTPSIPPELEGEAMISAPLIPSRYTELSPASGVLNLRQGMPYLEARGILLSAGWKPAKNDDPETKGAELTASDPVERFSQDLPELYFCYSTGLGLCFGKFKLEDGRSLAVTTTGMEPPGLIYWDSSFYIEPSETTLSAVEQLRTGLQYRKIAPFLIAEGWKSPINNPMYRSGELPSNSLNFLQEFPNFEDCHIEGDEIETCRFIFSTEGERRLSITTDIVKSESEYEPVIQSWSLD